MKKNQFRHGDLLLTQIEKIPESAKHAEDKILAYGEATGHKHQLMGPAIIYRDQAAQFVEVVAPAKLSHEEHKAIELPTGIYDVSVQREFDPYAETIRSVQD